MSQNDERSTVERRLEILNERISELEMEAIEIKKIGYKSNTSDHSLLEFLKFAFTKQTESVPDFESTTK